MGWLIKITDDIADWLVHELDARAQLRAGVWIALLSLPLLGWAPFSSEPLLIYLMSALALTLTGIGIVLSAEVLEQTEETDDDVEDHRDKTEPGV